MSDTADLRCKCLDPECRSHSFHDTDIGVDQTNSRFGNVSLFDCRNCGSRWLHYAVGDEAWAQSSRWYRGLISVKQSRSVTPENAREILASLSWYFYGGRDFETDGRQGCGPVSADLERGDGVAETFHGVA
jgi:hypothetical protein